METPIFSRILISLAKRLPFKTGNFYVPALGQVINQPGEALSVFNEIFFAGIYQPIAPLPPSPVIVDLGSNVGIFTIYINKRIKDGKIFAFEASPKAFAHLESNISRISRKNGNDIKLFQVAICDHAGEIDFFVDKTNDTNVAAAAFRDMSSMVDGDHFVPVRVSCNTLDHYVGGCIDLLKCDIEGAEYGVLTDELLDPAKIGQFAVEFHDIDAHKDEFDWIIDTALARGFVIWTEKNAPISSSGELHLIRKDSGVHGAKLKFCAKILLN